jgi:hypothetical protein
MHQTEHGTDSGYYRHIRQTGTPSEDWPRTACSACLAAHSLATSQRAKANPRKRKPTKRAPSRRTCRDCGKPVSETAHRCTRCARRHYLETRDELPTRWRRVGLIWKAA